MRAMCCVSTRYAHFYVSQIRQIWDDNKTFLGLSAGPNKTNLGKGKTFLGRHQVRGAASRRSRGGVPAWVLKSAKSGQTLWRRGLCAPGQRSAVSGQRSAGPRAGPGQRSAVSGADGGGGPKKVVAPAGSGPPLGCLSRRGRALRSGPQSAGSGPPLGVCARGGSAALGVSVGRTPCVLGRCAPCARGGGLPPRRLAGLPLRAPPLAALPSLRLPRPLAALPSLRLPRPPRSLPSHRLRSSFFGASPAIGPADR